jgi:Right handed beta helix region
MYVGEMLKEETDDVVHVSSSGDDRAFGSLSAPFASIARALTWLAERRTLSPDRDLTIRVHGGCYRIEQPLLIDRRHCGRGGAKTIIRGDGRNRTIVTGCTAAVPFPLAGPTFAATVPASYYVFAVDLPVSEFVPLDLGTVGFALRQPPSPPAIFLGGSRLPWSRWPTSPNLTAHVAFNKARPAELALAVAPEVLVGARNEDDLWIEMVVDHPWRWFMGRVNTVDFESGLIGTSVPAENGLPGQDVFQVAFRNGKGAIEPGFSVLDAKQRRIMFVAHADYDFRANAVEVCNNPCPLFYFVKATHVELSDIGLYGGLASAISVEKGEHIEIRRIDAHGFSYGGIDASGTAIEVSDCRIHDVGTTGITLNSGDPSCLRPGLSRVSNCKVHQWARWKKVYEPAVRLSGVGARVTGCDLHDGPHMAIALGGNNHVIAGNTFTRVARDFADMGAIYIDAGNRPLERGVVIVGNAFHDIGRNRPNHAVYVDRASCGVRVTANLFFRIGGPGQGGAAIYANGVSDVVVDSNLFVDCPIAVMLNFYLADWGRRDLEQMQAAWTLAASRLSDPALPHHAAYPELVRFTVEDRVHPRSNRVVQNIVLDLSGVTDRSGALQVHYGSVELVDMKGNQLLTSPDALSTPHPPIARMIAGMTRQQAFDSIVHACDDWPAASAAFQLDKPND